MHPHVLKRFLQEPLFYFILITFEFRFTSKLLSTQRLGAFLSGLSVVNFNRKHAKDKELYQW